MTRTHTNIPVTDVWIVSNQPSASLPFPFYAAARGKDGTTYRSTGFKYLETVDIVLSKVMDNRQVSSTAFKESDQYGYELIG